MMKLFSYLFKKTKSSQIEITDSFYYKIGRYSLLFPAGHRLPDYQKQNKKYDNYFGDWILKVYPQNLPLSVLDIGANVGDSAFYILSYHENARIDAVEASPIFFQYLNKNISDHNEESISSFQLGIVPQRYENQNIYITSNETTGHTSLNTGQEIAAVPISQFLQRKNYDLIKIDIDSFDVLIALEILELELSPESVLLVEIDIRNLPPTVDAKHEVKRLFEVAQLKNYSVIVVDNHGRPMFKAKIDIDILCGLISWIDLQFKLGKVDIYYLDVWFIPENMSSKFSCIRDLHD